MSSLTKLEVANNALNSIGERSLPAIGGILGNMVSSSLQEAIYFVCNQNEWKELHSIVNAASWSASQATMPERTYRVREFLWYTSPDGLPEVAYDYNKLIIPYTTIQEFQYQTLYPFEENAARPLVWSKLTDAVIVCNPYPNDATARAKAFFSLYRYPLFPVSDTDTFSCTDLLLNVIQYKMAELLAIKHIGDLETAAAMRSLYNEFYKQLMISQNGLPSFSMYKGRRR